MIVLSSSVASDLVEGIGARIGREVEVFTTISEAQYRRWSSGGWPDRLWLRTLGWVVHPVRIALRMLLAPRRTTFIVTTNPFFAPALAVWLGRWRGHRVIHHVFDLYPDALEAAGAIPLAGFRSRLISALTRSVQRHCAASVYLGYALQRHAEGRYGRPATSAVIDVAADESLFSTLIQMEARPLTLHYGGQLGTMHDADSLVEAVRRLQAEREAGLVRFDFRVGGANAGRLLALDGEPGVRAGPVLPAAEWRHLAQGIQVGLVSVTPAGANVCLPSKTYAMLAAGLAVLAVAPRASDLARIVEETGAGWVIDNAQSECQSTEPAKSATVGDEIATLIRHMLQVPTDVCTRRQAAVHAANTRFGRATIAGKWRQFLAEIA